VCKQPTRSSPIPRPPPPAPQRPGRVTSLKGRNRASEYRFGGVLQRRAPGAALWAAFGPSSGEEQQGAVCGVRSGSPRLLWCSESMYRWFAAFAPSRLAASTATQRARLVSGGCSMGQLGACALRERLSRTPTPLTRLPNSMTLSQAAVGYPERAAATCQPAAGRRRRRAAGAHGDKAPGQKGARRCARESMIAEKHGGMWASALVPSTCKRRRPASSTRAHAHARATPLSGSAWADSARQQQ